jgi:3-oxoadipate enol-lactonase
MEFAGINRLSIHYKWIDNGKLRTFLFINSLGTDFRIWERVTELLNDHGNILLFDKRGHGLSDVDENVCDLNPFADDAEALMHRLQINRCVVAGLSVGGMIAQILANRIPEKIEKLVLCDTCYKIGNELNWDERIATVMGTGLASISDGVILRWFSEKFRMKFPEKVAGYRNMLERCPVTGYIKACKAIRDSDLTFLAKKINMATLCIVGSEDKSTSPDEVKSLSNLIRGSRFEVIPGSGHIPCVDNPDALGKLIIDFIK